MKPPITWVYREGQSFKIWLKVWGYNHVVNPIVWSGFWLTRVDPALRWFERVVYCHHNARVVEDFEDKVSTILWNFSNLSKPYYTKEVCVAAISEHISDRVDEAYSEGRKDALDEFGIKEKVPDRGMIKGKSGPFFIDEAACLLDPPTICPTCATRWLWSPGDLRCYACGHGFEFEEGGDDRSQKDL